MIQVLLVTALCVISGIAWHALNDEAGSGRVLSMLSRAERYHGNADAMHDALYEDVTAALAVTKEDSEAAGEVLASARGNSRSLEENLIALGETDLPADVRRVVNTTEAMSRSYVALADRVITTAIDDHAAGMSLQAQFKQSLEELTEANDRLTALLANRVEAAENDSLRAAEAAKVWIVATSFTTALLAWTFVAFVSRSIRLSLRRVSDAARALAAGNLSVRSDIASQDEVGELAGAVNKMADDLQNMIDRLLADADRDAFSTQLAQALEMADTEQEVQGVVSRAMTQIGLDAPMELLLADSSGVDLQPMVEHPTAGAPGCGVSALSGCVAVRRGAPVVCADSEALNACPRLRGRSCGPVSAVCVPVGFMGRSFGVLHAAIADRKPTPPQQVAQLTALGSQTGVRIGTVRAFAKTQLHAYTDSLTGLKNRRAMEQMVAELRNRGGAYAFALADLDRFKALNDEYGHEAGDEALRAFAEVLRGSIREGDHAARWGGEEFALVFPGATAGQAHDSAERIRAALAELLAVSGHVPFTASFGIADSTMASEFEDLLRIADEALYRSKDLGRDRTTVAEASAEKMTRRSA
jgi:diguanylate cyclase (GGDEF)-like protein